MKLRFSFSSENERETIHDHSINILKNVGISVQSDEARAIFKYHGARVRDKKVYLNNEIIEKYLKCVPVSFCIGTSNHRMKIGDGKLHTMPPYGPATTSRSGITHPSGREDFVNFSKLYSLNENISMSCPYILEPLDIPFEYRDIYKIAITIKYSDKPTFSITNNKDTAKKSIELVQCFFDNKQDHIIIGNVNLSSPLIMGTNTSDVIMVHGEKQQPLMISCSGLSGLTSPPTLASNFILNNAATLGGIVFSQMVSPGLPVIYGFPLFGIDCFDAHASVGHPSTALFTMAAAEMGRYYNIPVRSGGTYTDSGTLDYRSGFESYMNLFSSVFSKTDLLMHTFGIDNSLNTINYNKYILDESLFNNIRLYLNGFEINDDTVMINEIKKAGSTGNYININNLRLMREQYPICSFKYDSIDDMLAETDKLIDERINSYEPLQLDKCQQKLLQSNLPAEYID